MALIADNSKKPIWVFPGFSAAQIKNMMNLQDSGVVVSVRLFMVVVWIAAFPAPEARFFDHVRSTTNPPWVTQFFGVGHGCKNTTPPHAESSFPSRITAPAVSVGGGKAYPSEIGVEVVDIRPGTNRGAIRQTLIYLSGQAPTCKMRE